MFDKFKATILSEYIVSELKELPIPLNFIFSKNKIHFPPKLKERLERLDFDPFQSTPLTDKTTYTIERVYHKETDKPVYEISYGNNTIRYIKVGWFDRLKLMYIHNRLWVQKEPLAILAIAISIIALFI